MHNIGIIIAMEKELDLFVSEVKNKHEQLLHERRFITGEYHGHIVSIVVCGIGKVNAALCTSDLINVFHSDVVINIGISGGLDKNLNIGDFVVGKNISYHDFWCDDTICTDVPSVFHSDEKLCALFNDLKHGLLCCGDRFIVSKKEMLQIKQRYPEALAVDMESAAIAHTCFLYKIPLLSIRQISDTPGVEHHAEQYDNFWKNVPQNSIRLLKEVIEKIDY